MYFVFGCTGGGVVSPDACLCFIRSASGIRSQALMVSRVQKLRVNASLRFGGCLDVVCERFPARV